MPPAIIADSDEDSDGAHGDSPAPEARADDRLLLPTRSSEGVSLTTSSTDPNFFQDIYNEHRAAARQPHSTASAGDGPESYGTSRLTSAPGRGETGKDLWDIPSSPELKMAKKVKQMTSKRTTSVKVTRGLRKNLERLGYESASGDDRDEQVHQREKRRRVGPSRNSQRDSNDVSLVKLPPQSSEGTGGNFIRPPVDGTPLPLCVAPKQLSASQKLEYQSIAAPSSSPPVRVTELHNPAIGSSGTATNVNTQRSHMLSSFDAGLTVRTPEHEMIRATKRLSSPRRRRRNSSPDIIAAVPPPTEAARPRKTRTNQGGTGAPDASEPPQSVIDDAEIMAAPKLEEDDMSDYAAPEKQAKPKRQRGRPKKGGDDKSDVASTAAARESAAKPKRKRGRPKKSEIVTNDEQDVPIADDGSQLQAATDEKLNQALAVGSLKDDVDQEKKLSAGSPVNGPTPDGLKQTPVDGVGIIIPTRARDEKSELEEEKKPRRNADLHNGKGVAKPDGSLKPLYRVGLSKRLRIAPLLKSLRK
ncbi:hypothetical protein O9K51_05351 [Purpureocillium lavendulum]|uniref:Uncharacterized protein n=1 Tax=Purpureocillium lavendulum TaxID=1247861 RepID=A0AB34FSA7_9HYPO|nr:hypothetical protein O9K51_05351 [Purpureocillium lavendulum]